MELESKTIIVSGASSGIGAAAARLFASEGANVVLGARRSAELEWRYVSSVDITTARMSSEWPSLSFGGQHTVRGIEPWRISQDDR